MRFKRVYIEITNVCNVQCSFCPEVIRDKEHMNTRQFEAIVMQVAPLTKDISLHLMGEPLSHYELDKFLQIAGEYDLRVSITTNALLLKRKQEVLMKAKSLKQINISVQSYHDNFPEKSLHDYLVKTASAIDAITRESPEVYINYRLWNIGSDAKENEEVIGFLEEYYQEPIKRVVDVGGIKSKNIKDRIYLHFDSRFEWPSLDSEYRGEEGTCKGLIDQVGIHANGDVVPCCLDKEANIKLGNIFNSKLEEIITSERAHNIITGFQKRQLVEKLCQHCDYCRRF